MAQTNDDKKPEASKAVATQERPERPPVPLMARGGAVRPIIPRSIEEAFRLAQGIARAGWAPKAYLKTKSEADGFDVDKITIGILAGMEAGFTPMAALQSIAVINGMPAIWGDGLIALVRSSGLSRYIKEWTEGEGADAVAYCETHRKGEDEPIRRSFGMADAKLAGLSGKSGPWSQYPKRMLQLRARAFCLRDGYADVLRGLRMVEEVQDYDLIDAGDGSYRPVPTMTDRPSRTQAVQQEVVRHPLVDDLGEVGDDLDAEDWEHVLRRSVETAMDECDFKRARLILDNNYDIAHAWFNAGQRWIMEAWNTLAGRIDLTREAARAEYESERQQEEAVAAAAVEVATAEEGEAYPEPTKIVVPRSMPDDQVAEKAGEFEAAIENAPTLDWLKAWRAKNTGGIDDMPGKAKAEIRKLLATRLAELGGA